MVVRLNILSKGFLKKFCYKRGRKRAEEKFEIIKDYLKKKEKILDIGSGMCTKCELLRERGYKITPVDVENLSVVENIKPIIYGGKKLPFKDKSFDVGFLFFVLHHTSKPDAVFKEAARVCKKLIIMEDIYNNSFHKYLTWFFDSLINQEFKGHPHSNKSDKEWRRLFKKHKFKLKKTHFVWSFPIMKHVTYFLEK